MKKLLKLAAILSVFSGSFAEGMEGFIPERITPATFLRKHVDSTTPEVKFGQNTLANGLYSQFSIPILLLLANTLSLVDAGDPVAIMARSDEEYQIFFGVTKDRYAVADITEENKRPKNKKLFLLMLRDDEMYIENANLRKAFLYISGLLAAEEVD